MYILNNTIFNRRFNAFLMGPGKYGYPNILRSDYPSKVLAAFMVEIKEVRAYVHNR